MIKKMQGGGVSAFVTYTPFTQVTQAQQSAGPAVASAGSDSGSESKLSDKDLMTMIKEIDGLPSDIDMTLAKI